MAAIIVRNLDDDVRRRIKERAAAHDRSMEAEARAILTAAVSDDGLVAAWLAVSREHRAGDQPDFVLPERAQPREIDLS